MPERWKERDVEWSIKDVGAPLLDSIARGLYSKEEVFREYVQNGVDAYVDFQHLTGLAAQNTVQVWIEADRNALHIMDRGVGMDWHDISTAKAIAVSPKLARPNDFAGFRGLGIWSGLAACDQLVLTTTKVNEPVAYRLTINCKAIVAHLEDPIPIDDLLIGRFQIHEIPWDTGDHYTQVKLVGVHQDRYGVLLDDEALRQYAEQHLPVPFDPTWPYTEQVRKILASVQWTGNFDLTINGRPVYRQFPPIVDLKQPQQEVIKSQGREVAVAWWCETDRRGSKKALEADKGRARNFAVRVKNFAIGRRGLLAEREVTDPENLDWFVGAIYVTDPDIRPDTKRTQFQTSARHDDVVRAIREFYTSIALRARGWSIQVTTETACQDAEEALATIEEILKSTAAPDESERRKIKDVWSTIAAAQAKLDSAYAEAHRQDAEGEALRTLIARSFLRKADVKSRVEAALGSIAGMKRRLESLAVGVDLTPVPKAAPNGRRTRGSRSRTAKAVGRPATTNDLLNTRTVAGTLPGLESPVSEADASNGADTQLNSAVPQLLAGGRALGTRGGQHLSLDDAIAACEAAVAAVVGSQSETFRLIMARLPAELQRRGLFV